jgi:hypothetical protein
MPCGETQVKRLSRPASRLDTPRTWDCVFARLARIGIERDVAPDARDWMGWWPILDIRPPYPLQGLPQIVNGIAIAIEHLLIGGLPYDAVNRCEESNEEQTAHLQTALLHSRCECGPRYEPAR